MEFEIKLENIKPKQNDEMKKLRNSENNAFKDSFN